MEPSTERKVVIKRAKNPRAVGPDGQRHVEVDGVVVGRLSPVKSDWTDHMGRRETWWMFKALVKEHEGAPHSFDDLANLRAYFATGVDVEAARRFRRG